MSFLNLLNTLSFTLTPDNIEHAIELVEKLIALSKEVQSHSETDNSNNSPSQSCSASGS